MATNNEINSQTSCYFRVYRNAAANNVTGNSTVYSVPFDTKIYDNLNAVNLGTGVFTVPITGIYCLQAHIMFKDLGAGMTSGYLKILGGNNIFYQNPLYSVSAAGYLTWQISEMNVSLVAGNTCQVQLMVAGGAGDTIDLQPGNDSCFFQGFLVYRI